MSLHHVELQVKIMPMAIAVERYLSIRQGMSSRDWESSPVFCTHNFFFASDTRGCLDDYMRPVDALLVFPSGQVLLLSERETDGVLRAMLDADGERHSQTILFHVSYTTAGMRPFEESPLKLPRGVQAGNALTYRTLASMWIFSGTTSIPPPGRGWVKALVRNRKIAVQSLLSMRGLDHVLPRSDLERLLT